MSNELAKQFIEIMFAEENADIDAWVYALKQKPEVREWAVGIMSKTIEEKTNEKQNIYYRRVHHDGVVLCVACTVHLLGAFVCITSCTFMQKVKERGNELRDIPNDALRDALAT